MTAMAVYRQVQVLASQLGKELVLLEPTTDKVAYCNASASVVYALCDGVRSESEIVQLLVDAYPESADQIPAQVAQAIEALCQAGMLTS